MVYLSPKDFAFFPNIKCEKGEDHAMERVDPLSTPPDVSSDRWGRVKIIYLQHVWRCVNCGMKTNTLTRVEKRRLNRCKKSKK